MRRLVILLASVLIHSACIHAQKFSVSTDLLGYASLGTMNIDASYALSRRWSMVAGVRYNPFTFTDPDGKGEYRLRQQSYSIGARLWPWHTWSGWWFASKLRYQEYNMGGISSKETEEGDRIGAGIYSGYTHMLSPHLNLEFGLGLWTGYDRYVRYSCPTCGYTVQDGERIFLLPDDVMLSLVYVF